MVVCKFFAQGHCRYGNVCFNEHVRPSTASTAFGSGGAGANRFQALAGHEGGAKEAAATTNNPYLSSANAPSIVEEICKEMDIWEKSGMWPFSCFGFAKDVPCIPGFDDISLEEMRLRAYEEKTKGNLAPYENYWRSQLANVKAKFQVFKQPTQATKVQMVERVRAIQTDAIRALSNPKGTTAASKNVFGSPVTTTPSNPFGAAVSTASVPNVFGSPSSTSTPNVFGSPSTTSTPNVFGSPNASVFGATTSAPNTFGNPAVSTTSSLFGAAPTSNSVFGGGATMGATTAPTSLFGAPATLGATITTTSSVFGAPATMNASSNLFGAMAQPTAAPTQSVFGAAATPSTFGAAPAASSIFGAPATTSNLFGSSITHQNPTQTAPVSIFGAPTTSSSLFGGAPTTSHVFGAAASAPTTAVVAPTASNLFGAPAATASSGGAPPSATGAPMFGAPGGPGVFGSPATSTTASSVFGTTQPTASITAPQSSSSSRPSAFPQLDVIDDFLLPTSTFSLIESLTAEDKAQFEADEFLDLSIIPLRPPPREYV